MKGVHRTVSIYPETDEKITSEHEATKLSKIVIVDNAINFYIKYKNLEEKLKVFVK